MSPGGVPPRGVRHVPDTTAVMDCVSHWRALLVLGTAQFLMVLDTSVMNVSISRLVDDFDTEVTPSRPSSPCTRWSWRPS